MPVEHGEVSLERSHRLYWWKEALIVGAFYLVYSWTRNLFGSNAFDVGDPPEEAFTNAVRVIRVERFLGLYHEETLQDLFLPYRAFMQFWNTYYGTAHFFVTIFVFALLFAKRPAVFPQWRNSLAIMTALAIVGFALFPLMPPRLLDRSCEEYGGACIETDLRPDTRTFGYVDSLAELGGPWSFESDTVTDISNQYAAMPSMHIGWSTWCAVAMWPLLRRRWQRVAVFLYPLATMFCIIVTANHFWIDGAGGLLAFAIGTLSGWGLHRWNQQRLDARHLTTLTAARLLPGGHGDQPIASEHHVARTDP
ncbi:MAG: phosphatase PAP2 family protein [Acidimicrobiia bacterium]|nr:phosphatase PAP2 family protein [Acidimicrobiia bacterium]